MREQQKKPRADATGKVSIDEILLVISARDGVQLLTVIDTIRCNGNSSRQSNHSFAIARVLHLQLTVNMFWEISFAMRQTPPKEFVATLICLFLPAVTMIAVTIKECRHPRRQFAAVQLRELPVEQFVSMV